MIYLEKGQKVFEKPELVVYEQTGERNDTDMVICAKVESPEEPFCWLEAQYIAYGNVVYSISDDKELEKEILKMDPDSTINDVVVENTVQENTPPAAPEQPVAEPTPSAGTPVSAQETAVVPPTENASSTPATPEVLPETVTSATTTPVEVVEPTPVEPVVVPEVPPAPVEPEVVPVVEPVPEPAPEIVSTSRRKSKKTVA
jgi:hypothetical protein